jgi:hypothetical protein
MNDSKSTRQLNKEAIVEAWHVDYDRFEADGEFRQARRRAIRRLLFSVFSGRNGQYAARGSSVEIQTHDGLLIPIDSIVGMIDRRRAPNWPFAVVGTDGTCWAAPPL